MSRRVVVRPLAKEDLDEQARYIARDSVAAALRFLDVAESAFDRLNSMSEVGRHRPERPPVERLGPEEHLHDQEVEVQQATTATRMLPAVLTSAPPAEVQRIYLGSQGPYTG